MSAILDKLLKGQNVEWLRIAEVGELVRGNGLQKSDFTESGVPAIHYGQIYTFYGNFTTETKSFVSPELAEKLRKVNKGDVVITNTSENLEDVGKALLYLGEKQAVTGGHATIFRPGEKILGKYFVYFTQSDFFASEKRKYAKGTKVIDVSATDMAKILIAIPPLDVQAEIVRILDAFTAVTAELTAELNMREKQYQYYRNKLLSFSEAGIETDSNRQQQTALCEGLANNVKQNHQIIWKSLGEVAEYSKSRISFDKLNEKNYIGVDNLLQNRMGKTNSSYLPTSGNLTAYFENDILIGNIRPYLKKIWQANQIGGTNGDVLVIHLKDKNILPRYLYQILADDKFFDFNMQNAKGAKMPRGNKEAILKYSFPVPPLDEQKRIVNILDKFEALTHSITEGLPKEITLRKQQYEYYREQLIDFPKN